jgi:hypothetical protein
VSDEALRLVIKSMAQDFARRNRGAEQSHKKPILVFRLLRSLRSLAMT